MRREISWTSTAIALITIEYMVAYLIGISVGFSYKLALYDHLMVAMVLSFVVAAVVFSVLLAKCIVLGVSSPIAQLRRDLPVLAPVVVGISLVALQIGALNWTKSMIPLVTTFWADELLASADRVLFRADPWIFLHFMPVPLIDELYSAWAPIKFITILVIMFLPSSPLKARALAAYFLTMFFGLIGQYTLPSAGPIFYERLGLGDNFSAIPVPPITQLASDYLWQAYIKGGGDVGTGISAFPSMHVAIALWIALSVQSFNQRMGYIAHTYFAVICFGSVYLGWHYAMDGIGGSFIAMAAWWIAKFICSSSASSQDLSKRRNETA